MAEFFMMPAVSPTMKIGRLIGWSVKEGDEVEFGTVLAEVETDKATAEIESFDAAIVIKILRQGGDEVPINTPIAIIGESMDEDISALLAEFEKGTSEAPAPEAPEATTTSTERPKAGPGARVTADQHGISLSKVQGTGPRGRILSSDVKDASAPKAQKGKVLPYAFGSSPLDESIMEMPLSFTPAGNYPKRRGKASMESSQVSEVIPNSMMRKTIARRLKESYLDAPVFFLNAHLNCDNLVAFRSQIKEAGVRVSYNDLVIKAVARALIDVPAVNASWSEEAIIHHSDVHVGIAVAIPDGLITPVIRNTNTKGLAQIGEEARELAGKARDRKLQPEDYSNSTFTISNLGMMKIDSFTAIINPPNAAILAVGSMQQEPVIKDGELSIGWKMKITMTCDHRVIDGALGAEFLLAVRKYIEFPALLAG
jgi:pyruvate dehydrogenase E2 component (dihydrolipoamide acetyltransferase)